METNDGGQRGAFTGMDDGQMSKKKVQEMRSSRAAAATAGAAN